MGHEGQGLRLTLRVKDWGQRFGLKTRVTD